MNKLNLLIVLLCLLNLSANAQQCQEKVFDIVYVNGQGNTANDAKRSLDQIKNIIGKETINTQSVSKQIAPNSQINYINYYNQTMGNITRKVNGVEEKVALFDFVESCVQKLMTELPFTELMAFPICYNVFIDIDIKNVDPEKVKPENIDIEHREKMYNLLQLSYDELYQALSQTRIQDTEALKNIIRSSYKDDKRMLIISHSQGNLFTNAAYQELAPTPQDGVLFDYPLYKWINDKLANAQVATPANQISIPNGNYITNHLDAILEAGIWPIAPLPSNFPIASDYVPPLNDPNASDYDFTNNHGFLSAYLFNSPAGNSHGLYIQTVQNWIDVASKLTGNCDLSFDIVVPAQGSLEEKESLYKLVPRYNGNKTIVSLDWTTGDWRSSSLKGLGFGEIWHRFGVGEFNISLRAHFSDGTSEDYSYKLNNELIAYSLPICDDPRIDKWDRFGGRYLNPDGSLGGYLDNNSWYSIDWSNSYISYDSQVCGVVSMSASSSVLNGSIIEGTTLIGTQVKDSSVRWSNVSHSNIDNSLAFNSEINSSLVVNTGQVVNSTLSNSTSVNALEVWEGQLTNVELSDGSNIANSTVTNSQVLSSGQVWNSIVQDSLIQSSQVSLSEVKESSLVSNSGIYESNIFRATLSQSYMYNSSWTGNGSSAIEGSIITNGGVLDGGAILMGGYIDGGQVYGNGVIVGPNFYVLEDGRICNPGYYTSTQPYYVVDRQRCDADPYEIRPENISVIAGNDGTYRFVVSYAHVVVERGMPVEYYVEWGDGTYSSKVDAINGVFSVSNIIEHKYGDEGHYNPRFVIFYANGGRSSWIDLGIDVTIEKPSSFEDENNNGIDDIFEPVVLLTGENSSIPCVRDYSCVMTNIVSQKIEVEYGFNFTQLRYDVLNPDIVYIVNNDKELVKMDVKKSEVISKYPFDYNYTKDGKEYHIQLAYIRGEKIYGLSRNLSFTTGDLKIEVVEIKLAGDRYTIVTRELSEVLSIHLFGFYIENNIKIISNNEPYEVSLIVGTGEQSAKLIKINLETLDYEEDDIVVDSGHLLLRVSINQTGFISALIFDQFNNALRVMNWSKGNGFTLLNRLSLTSGVLSVGGYAEFLPGTNLIITRLNHEVGHESRSYFYFINSLTGEVEYKVPSGYFNGLDEELSFGGKYFYGATESTIVGMEASINEKPYFAIYYNYNDYLNSQANN